MTGVPSNSTVFAVGVHDGIANFHALGSSSAVRTMSPSLTSTTFTTASPSAMLGIFSRPSA
jgi:hypothetical protein